jgi:hypothetical protein
MGTQARTREGEDIGIQSVNVGFALLQRSDTNTPPGDHASGAPFDPKRHILDAPREAPAQPHRGNGLRAAAQK